jgi:CheY-like chemotaxis protein
VSTEGSEGRQEYVANHSARVAMNDELTDPASIPRPRARNITVLLIEDDPSVSHAMTRLLRLKGYEVVSAATRGEALRQVEVHGLRPDLILTDFHLPMGTRGDEIVAEIAARLHFKTPTIMLTSIPDPLVKQVKSVVDRILTKPVDTDVLQREIEILLGKPV